MTKLAEDYPQGTANIADDRVLATDAFLLKRTTYSNAISFKFDNRRVTVAKEIDGWGLEFRCIDHEPTPHAICAHIHGRMALTRIKLSKEAAEIVMISLAEQMGFRICR